MTAAPNPAAGLPALSLERIAKTYGRTPVLDDINFQIAPGETLCLLGPSGCGKTTTLLIIAGVESAQSGRILSHGKVLADDARFVPPEQRGIGLIFQDYALFPHLTALGNVAFGLKGGGKKERARAELDRLRLAGKADAYPHMLSGGEQQRVALARALVRGPALLLMDEPFSSLDRMLREEMREETRTILRARKTTCLFVTHDPEEAMRMGGRIALMRRGRIVQQGAPRDLYERPVDAPAARFFGRVNVLAAQIASGRARNGLLDLPAPGLPEGCKVRILIRPEGLIPAEPAAAALQGEIEEVCPLGSETLIQLRVTAPPEGASLRLTARLARRRAAAQSLAPGQRAGFRLDDSCVFIFPEGEDDSPGDSMRG